MLRRIGSTPSVQAVIFIIVCFISPQPADALDGSRWAATGIEVHDTDSSLATDPAGRKVRIQLWGIDGPEKNQRKGIEAAAAVAAIMPDQVLVEERGHDKYERLLAVLHTPDGTVQETLLSLGWVWVSDRYCDDQELCDKWRDVQREAVRNKRGLWQEWEGTVTGIADADTVTVTSAESGHSLKIRLWGIDAPETRQTMGQEATRALHGIIAEPITIEGYGYDKYGRLLAMLKNPGGASIQEALISEGWVWVYEDYCNEQELCDRWRGLQEEARRNRLGLWRDPDPTPPWKWRKQQREARARARSR